MTVSDLEKYLIRFPNDAKVVFEPLEMTGIGIPRWLDASVRREYDGDGKPTGVVIVQLKDMGDC